jgi:hypothetical protein
LLYGDLSSTLPNAIDHSWMSQSIIQGSLGGFLEVLDREINFLLPPTHPEGVEKV